MKRFLTALMAASAIFAMNSCKEDTPVEELNGPSIEWESNSDFSTVDITETMDVNLTIKAPAGIKSFTVKVDSEPLNNGEGLLNGFKLSELDLVNPSEETAFIVTMILGEGQTVADATELNLDLSTLVPLIAGLTTEDGYHSFTLNIVDNNAKSLEKTCRFHRIGEDTPSYAAPTMTWEGNENFDTMEIVEGMSVNLSIDVPAGIKSLVVDINSAPLNSMGMTTIDFVNPGDLQTVVDMILSGQDITTVTSLTLDLSSLLPMLLMLPTLEPDSDHVFTVNLTDKVGQSLEQACSFHYTGETASLSVDESSVDLWANTVKLNVSGEVTSVAYREKDTGTWIAVKADENGEYIVAPVWNKGQNDAGLTVYTPETGTGIFAGKTYEFQLNGETVADAELTTASGDVIPNGDMSAWSMIGDSEKPLPSPNASSEQFWSNGNNAYCYPIWGDDDPVFLCSEDNGSAKLQANKVLGAIFACGNMFTGSFSQENTSGVASFGQKYDWTSRPKSLKLNVKMTLGQMDSFGTNDPMKSELESSKPIDNARIYAVVVDWTDQHGVKSGLGVALNEMNVWDPATQDNVAEGDIIGYASIEFNESISDFQLVEIPFEWYDTEAKPASGNYSIVISCATSNRGDYLTGCSNNKLWVDDFEWVY